MPESKIFLSEITKVFQKNTASQVINLDEKFNYKFDFSTNRLEDAFKLINWHLPPVKWSYYRISFITQGEADAVNGIYKFRVKKNMLLITPPRVITTSKDWSHDTKGYTITFNSQFFLKNNFSHKCIENKKILTASVRPYLVVSDDQAKELTILFEKILHEHESTHPYKDEMLALKLIELLIISERLFADDQQFETDLPSMNVIKRFLGLMETNFLHQHSVAFYASKLSMHPNYLNSLVKKHTGITAKESIQNRIVLETKYLLHSTNLSVKEISNRLGFTDPNYFTVFFKRAEKLSPIHYRASFI